MEVKEIKAGRELDALIAESEEADTAELAICKAALKAVGHEF